MDDYKVAAITVYHFDVVPEKKRCVIFLINNFN